MAGKGAPGKGVSIYNASKNKLLGTTTVRSDGNWSRTIYNLSSDPDRVRVTSNGESVTVSTT
jgi:hypothetical protein